MMRRGAGARDVAEMSLAPRPATSTDAAQLNALARSAYEIYVSVIGREPIPMAIDWGNLLNKQEVWLVEGASGSIVGSLALDVKADHLVVWSVAVAPQHQHLGIGRRLMAFAERRARELQRLEIRLFTNLRMERNIALYQRLGYAEIRREHLPDRVLVHMTKLVSCPA
jgi:ribosomal protein S18 acetylase RimI-like enzyme